MNLTGESVRYTVFGEVRLTDKSGRVRVINVLQKTAAQDEGQPVVEVIVMDNLGPERLEYLEELLDQYASAQESMAVYQIIPDDYLKGKGPMRRQYGKHYREERDKVREQIIRLFL
jgi:hypothetical protein